MFSLAHFEHELLNIVYLGAIASNITERAEISIELRFLDDDAVADGVGGGQVDVEVSVFQLGGYILHESDRGLELAGGLGTLAGPSELEAIPAERDVSAHHRVDSGRR